MRFDCGQTITALRSAGIEHGDNHEIQLRQDLLGFGFFGVSVIWVYNAFVPIFLANKFGLEPAFIGFFMTLDNVAALFIQPPVGAWVRPAADALGEGFLFF